MRRVKIVICFTWFITLVSFTVPIFFSKNYEYYLYLKAQYMCPCQIRYLWFAVATYPYMPFLSGTIMILSSIGIIRKLKENKKLSEDNAQHKAKLARNNKAVKLILITAVAFAVAFFPFQCLVVIEFMTKEKLKYPSFIDFIVIWLANINSFANVIVYLCVYSSFRVNSKKILVQFFTCNRIKLENKDNFSEYSSSKHTGNTNENTISKK